VQGCAESATLHSTQKFIAELIVVTANLNVTSSDTNIIIVHNMNRNCLSQITHQVCVTINEHSYFNSHNWLDKMPVINHIHSS